MRSLRFVWLGRGVKRASVLRFTSGAAASPGIRAVHVSGTRHAPTEEQGGWMMRRIVVGSLSIGLLSACGLIKVNVNGEAVALGGDSPRASASRSSRANSSAESARAGGDEAGSGSKKGRGDPGRKPVAVTIDPSLTATPLVIPVNGVIIDSTQSRVVGSLPSECANDMAQTPLVVFELKQVMPKGFSVALTGGGGDGLVVRGREKNLVWTACPTSIGIVPTLGDLREGWQPGTYEVLTVARGRGTADYQVEFFNTNNRAPWGSAVQQLTIGKKLAKPMYVEVTVPAGRTRLRELHAGRGCKLPFAAEPQLALTLERPIPGLVIRPLPTAEPVALRVESLAAGARDAKHCAHYEESVVVSRYWPSWRTTAEAHFGKDDDGTFGISLANANGDASFKVTLMIFDASTTFDPVAAVPSVDGVVPFEAREVFKAFPELDVRSLELRSYEGAALSSKLFARVPKPLFVYAKLDLDKELASAFGSGTGFPKKDEPLVLIGLRNNDRARVMTADGLQFELLRKYLVDAPSGPVALPSEPRKLAADLRAETVWTLSPPSARAIREAFEAREMKHGGCADRVWAPYERQLDGATWRVNSGSGNTVTVESPRAQQISDAGERAIDAACGSADARANDKEATRVKLLAEIEKERKTLLGAARAGF